jgi:hypothetical protein
MFFAASLKIETSTNPELPAGLVVDWYQGYDKQGAEGRISAFLQALGYSEADVDDEATLIKIVDPKVQDAAGAKVRVMCDWAETKAGKKIEACGFHRVG